MSTIAQQFGMTEALEILGIKAINEGTSTGNNWFSNGEVFESYSPVDGQLIGKVKASTAADYEKAMQRSHSAADLEKLTRATRNKIAGPIPI